MVRKIRPAFALLSAVTMVGVLLTAAPAAQAATTYQVGVGIADITGPAAEVGMMGYAKEEQTTQGIHSRLWARAFVIGDPAGRRAVFVNTDLAMVTQAVHHDVLRRLTARFGSQYTAANVIISATHTHAGPGGYSHYRLYSLTTKGFEPGSYEAIVGGIVRAVAAAHADVAPGTVKIATGTLSGAQVNRSLEAFNRNPAADRTRFPNGLDRRMTVLRFEQGGQPVGMISWFATHGTSMTNTNRVISPDNKGYAEYHTEHDVHGVEWAQRGRFVAAFAQSSAGDMSPNLRDGGRKGPTDDEFENTRIIGKLQADKATQLFNSATELLDGSVDFRQRYVDFSKVDVAGRYTPDGQPRRTCPAAIGQGFTAGAEDGPGPSYVREGELAGHPLLTATGGVLAPPSEALKACQAPKPIFLATGEQSTPWTPQVLSLHVLRIGQFAITATPAEFTVVAGQRLLDTVGSELGGLVRHQVHAGYSNAYAGYVTTPEEYDAQHYEGASTHFGRYTLPAYQQEMAKLAAAMRLGQATPSAVTPISLANQQVQLNTGVVMDSTPFGRRFGDAVVQPAASYRRGDKVAVSFYTGHPKNNLRLEGTFLEVQLSVGGQWRTVATDNDWSTVYRWQREGTSASRANITWTIPANATPGTYRIVHHGDSKSLFGAISAFAGTTRTFTVS